MRSSTAHRLVVPLFSALLLSGGMVVHAQDCRLNFMDFINEGEGGFTALMGVYHMTITPDGKFIYTNGVSLERIGVFERNIATGELNQIQYVQLDTSGAPLNVVASTMNHISGDGRDMYIPAYYANRLYHYRRDTTTGLLTFDEMLSWPLEDPDINGMSFIRESLDGRFLYITCVFSDALLTFERNPVDGRLTLVNTLKSADLTPAAGLDGPINMDVSADGRFLYVASYLDHAITVLSLNQTTGVPTFVQAINGGAPGPMERFVTPRWFTLSPTQDHGYSTAHGDAALFVFSRNTTTGELAYQEAYFNTPDLTGAQHAAFTPDGSRLFVSGYYAGAFVQFSIDPLTGSPTYERTYRDDEATGVQGCNHVREIRFSPDGLYAYVASWSEFGVGVWQVQTGSATGGAWRLYE